MSSRCGSGAAGAVYEVLPSTPVRRQLGTSTDDAAIFLEDTVDRVTAQCIDASPSALALLSPQHMPTGSAAHVDVTEYDASYLGTLSVSHRKSVGGGSSSKARSSQHQHRALHDVTNTSGAKMSWGSSSGSKSPNPKTSGRSLSHGHHLNSVSHGTSLSRSTPPRSRRDRSPSASEPMVPLAEYEALQRERNRYEKMYEHQRALYEDMAEKHADAYQTLQEKIIEVVALSTRNEESKRFIRQLKREMSESRTRVMDMQNKALEEAKMERSAKIRYESLIKEHERKYERLAERHETKLAGLESLVRDLTCLRGEQDAIHVSQLDSLLKAAYSKSTALFSDLLRQGKQIDLLYEAKGALEAQLEQQRKEKRELEATLCEERRRMASEMERMIEQIEEQQQSILNLRQMLIRTMDNRDNVFAYSRGPHHARDLEDDKDDSGDGSTSSSLTCSPPSSAIGDEGEESEEVEEVEEAEDESRGNGGGDVPHVRDDAKKSDANVVCSPVSVRGVTTATGSVISASSGNAAPLSSNSVVVPRHMVTAGSQSSAPLSKTRPAAVGPPLPSTSRDGSSSLRQGPHRNQRSGSDAGRRASEGAMNEDHSLRKEGSSDKGITADPGITEASPSAASAASTVVSRRPLDFSSALAAVAEKRRRDRAMREESSLKHVSDKENSKPTAPHRAVLRSCAVGSITTARKAVLMERKGANAGAQRSEDDEAEPRLFPRHILTPRE